MVFYWMDGILLDAVYIVVVREEGHSYGTAKSLRSLARQGLPGLIVFCEA